MHTAVRGITFIELSFATIVVVAIVVIVVLTLTSLRKRE